MNEEEYFLENYQRYIPKKKFVFFGKIFDISGCNLAINLLNFIKYREEIPQVLNSVRSNLWKECIDFAEEFGGEYHSKRDSGDCYFGQTFLNLSVELDKKTREPSMLFEKFRIYSAMGGIEELNLYRGSWEVGKKESGLLYVELRYAFHMHFKKLGNDNIKVDIDSNEEHSILESFKNIHFTHIEGALQLTKQRQSDRLITENEKSASGNSTVEKIINYLKWRCPEELAGSTKEKLQEKVEAGIKRARVYGIEKEKSLMAFVELMFTVTPDFDEYPKVRQPLRWKQFNPNQVIVAQATEFLIKKYCGNPDKSEVSEKWKKILSDAHLISPKDTLQKYSPHDATTATISPCGKIFAIGFRNGEVYLGHVNTQYPAVKCSAQLQSEDNFCSVEKIKFLPNSQEVMVVGSKDALIFDTHDGKQLQRFMPFGRTIYDIAWAGKHCYVISEGQYLYFFKFRSKGNPEIREVRLNGCCQEIAFREAFRELVCLDGFCWHLVNIESLESRKIDMRFGRGLTCQDGTMHISQDGNYYLQYWDKGFIADVTDGQFNQFSWSVYPTDISIGEGGKKIVFGSIYGDIGVYECCKLVFGHDSSIYQNVFIKEISLNPINNVFISQNNKYTVFTDIYGNCGIIDIESQKILHGYIAVNGRENIAEGFCLPKGNIFGRFPQ